MKKPRSIRLLSTSYKPHRPLSLTKGTCTGIDEESTMETRDASKEAQYTEQFPTLETLHSFILLTDQVSRRVSFFVFVKLKENDYGSNAEVKAVTTRRVYYIDKLCKYWVGHHIPTHPVTRCIFTE